MSHQDLVGDAGERTHAAELWQAWQWLTSGRCFQGIQFRQDCTWTVQTLAFAAVLWGWSDQRNLTDRFQDARQIIAFLGVTQGELGCSYQAFIKLLRKWTSVLRVALTQVFRGKMRTELGSVWQTHGWCVFAADGSRINVPRTRGNEERYCPHSKLSRAAQRRRQNSKRSKQRKKALRARQAREAKAAVPLIWLTVLWQVGSGLPWDWRSGPADSSERADLTEMLPELPANALLTADAGFVGYEFWHTIQAAEKHLLVRVGGNVKLLKKLGFAKECAGSVYLWPDKAAARNQPPLILRLIVVHDGRQPLYLVTDLTSAQLSDRAAAEIYARRWGIELFFRHCKQTFERHKLRSHNPDNALLELDWSLLSMWALGLHSHARLVGQGIEPAKISFVKVLRAYRASMRQYREQISTATRLTKRLDLATVDEYQRADKASRHYPRKKQHRVTKPPTLQIATQDQIQAARKIRNAQKGLTA